MRSVCSQSVAEFDLRSVRYEVKSPCCHELYLVTPPNDRISFTFRCEREAKEWATVVMSSLREAHRGGSNSQFFLHPTDKQSQHCFSICFAKLCSLVLFLLGGVLLSAYPVPMAFKMKWKSYPVGSALEQKIQSEMFLKVSSAQCCVF